MLSSRANVYRRPWQRNRFISGGRLKPLGLWYCLFCCLGKFENSLKSRVRSPFTSSHTQHLHPHTQLLYTHTPFTSSHTHQTHHTHRHTHTHTRHTTHTDTHTHTRHTHHTHTHTHTHTHADT